jgi:hypothetical protein
MIMHDENAKDINAYSREGAEIPSGTKEEIIGYVMDNVSPPPLMLLLRYDQTDLTFRVFKIEKIDTYDKLIIKSKLAQVCEENKAEAV